MHGEKVVLRTINNYAHLVVHNVGDLQDFRYCHPCFLLGERIQSLQSILNIAFSQQFLQVFF